VSVRYMALMVTSGSSDSHALVRIKSMEFIIVLEILFHSSLVVTTGS
jgi:hypothetical protein